MMRSVVSRRGALLAVLALVLAACGRRNDPEAPAGGEQRFPRQYPSR